MNKRLSLLLHETTGQQYLQKTTRTELSEEEQQDSNSVSRAVSILQLQPDQQKPMERTGKRFLEFEEFNVEPSMLFPKNVRRKFNIEVPEAKFEQHTVAQPTIATTHMFTTKVRSPTGTVCNEPPAPSNKGKPKAFVFPVTTVPLQNPPTTSFHKPNLLIKQPCSIPNIANFEKSSDPYPSQPQSPVSGSRNPSYLVQKDEDPSRLELLSQLETYRRELLKRDAQIELLQKIVADNIARPPPCDTSRMMQEKDELNSELMRKLTELAETLKHRNQQLALYKYENNKMECMIEAMNHDAYLNAKHQQNEMLSQQHHPQKQRRQVSTHWEEDFVMRTSINKSNGAKQIQGIERKMEQLKSQQKQQHMSVTAVSQQENNRSNAVPPAPMGCPSLAKKIKASIQPTAKPKEDTSVQGSWYCQTSKNRPKASGYFDFKQQQLLKENVSDAASQHRRKQKAKDALQ